LPDTQEEREEQVEPVADHQLIPVVGQDGIQMVHPVDMAQVG
jgi:hypothetical protein